MKIFRLALAASLLIIAAGPVPGAQAFAGGFIDSNLVLSKSGSPYILNSTIQIPRGASLTVEAGVVLDVRHKDSVFKSAGNLQLLGSANEKIQILNAENIWETAGSFNSKSTLKMSHVEALGIASVFSNLNQGQFLDVRDSVFIGDARKGQPFYSWLTFCEDCKLIGNIFRSLPGIWILTYSSPARAAEVSNNLFIGNSSSRVEPLEKGKWLASNGSTRVTGNSFTGFSGPILALDKGDQDWNLDGNFFDGADPTKALSFVTRDLSGFRPLISSTLQAPDSRTPKELRSLPADPKVFSWLFKGQTLAVTAMSIEPGVDNVSLTVGGYSSTTALFSNTRRVALTFRGVPLSGKGPLTLSLSSRFLSNSFDLLKPHSSCVSIWREFDGGVARSGGSKNKGPIARKNPTVFPALFTMTSSLDRDRDGIVCER